MQHCYRRYYQDSHFTNNVLMLRNYIVSYVFSFFKEKPSNICIFPIWPVYFVFLQAFKITLALTTPYPATHIKHVLAKSAISAFACLMYLPQSQNTNFQSCAALKASTTMPYEFPCVIVVHKSYPYIPITY